MRLFGGISFPLAGRARAGISRTGRPWIGARARGPAGTYAGIIASTGGHGSATPMPKPARISLAFDIDDDGRVYLDGCEVNVEQLRAVVAASDRLRGVA